MANIETVIGRRFKKHGMSWTTEGANNLKLRTLWCNKSDWDAFWLRQPSQRVSFPQLINTNEIPGTLGNPL